MDGDVDLFHIHHKIYRTHEINTVAAVLSVILSLSVAVYKRTILSYVPVPSMLSTPVRETVFIHVIAFTCAHVIAVLYKFIIIIYKVSKYRSLTKTALKQEEGPPQKILIIYASVGSGHKRAAQAIQEALSSELGTTTSGVEIRMLDIVDTQEWFLKTIYKELFMTLVGKDWGQAFIGLMFEKSNASAPGIDIQHSGYLQTLLEESFSLSFVEYLFDYKPDVIINTHFLGLKIVSHLRSKLALFQIPQVTAVTDFDVHAYWALGQCEQFFVARDECRHALCQMGIDAKKVQILGMPIVRAFKNIRPKAKCVKDLGLNPRLPIILLMSGGDDIFETYDNLLRMKTGCQIAVICGRQDDIRAELRKVEVPNQHKVKLEGFTTVMHEYLQCADIIITKPGGLTTAESLATGTAIAVFHSLPGQELRNADMILEEGVGFKISDSRMLAYKIEKVIKNKRYLSDMKKKALKIGSTDAAEKIAKYILSGKYRENIPVTGGKNGNTMANGKPKKKWE